MAFFERFGKRNSKTEEYRKWKEGLDHELAFWVDWADHQEEDLNWRLRPEKELQEAVKVYLDSSRRTKGINILDVGAGPITFLGNLWGDYRINITAIDALADKYSEMLKKRNVDPPIETIQLCAEDLTEKFPENTFDLAFSFNALDHAHDPIKAIKAIVGVIKPGSFFLLRSFVNEAECADYTGLHQWNFFDRKGRFFISSKKHAYDVKSKIKSIAEIVSVTVKNKLFEESPRPILWVDIRKKK